MFIIIPISDQYSVLDMDMFKILIKDKGHDIVYRDIYCDFNKLTINVLKKLVKHAGVKGYSKIDKNKLVSIVSSLYIFEK
jgi:hypothetical protein